MGVPRTYRKSAERAIASYSYTDIAEGTGVVAFYGANTDAGYILTTNSSLGSRTAWIETTSSEILNEDFDVTFNSPRVIKGTLLANIPVSFATGNSKAATATITVYHYDGTTETQLGTATHTTAATTATQPDNLQIICLETEIAKTKFKKGETLRITVVTSVDSSGSTRYTGFDPKGRIPSGELSYSKMIFFVPFDLDL